MARTLPHGQCHMVFPHAYICINSGADALVRGRPPGRPVELWKDLILREKCGTGASRADRGVRPIKSMQDPAYGKTMWHCPHGRGSEWAYQERLTMLSSPAFTRTRTIRFFNAAS